MRVKNGLQNKVVLDKEKEWLLHIVSAMSAGALATSLTNPLWVIKTRFMVNHDLHLPMRY